MGDVERGLPHNVTGLAGAAARVKGLAGVVRLRPYDTATPEGRAAERYRRAALTALSAAIARAATITVAFVSVPLCIGYLGNERYGMWLTLSSLFSFAYVADLGVTAGLQLAISRCDARDDQVEARRYVASAMAILLTTCAVGALVLGILLLVVDWPGVFNVASPQARAEAGLAAVVYGATWLLNILTAVVTRINYGYQEGYVTNGWQILGTGLSLSAVVVCVRLELGLPALVFALAGAPAVALIFNGTQLFGWRRPWLRPRWCDVDRSTSRRLLGDGVWYLVAGLAYIAVLLSSNMVIAQVLGAEVVPEFGVPQRVAAVLTLLIAAVVNSLLPAYTEAISRGDHAWVRRALARSLILAGLIGGVGGAAFIIGGRWLIELWVGDSVAPTLGTLTGLAVWALIAGLANGLNSFVQGAGGVRANGLQWLVAAVLSLPCQLAAVHWLGVVGVGWGLATTELLCRLVPGILFYRSWLASISSSGPS